MKIIFITIEPFTIDHLKKYGIEQLRNIGFQVEIINVFKWVFKDLINVLPGYSKNRDSNGLSEHYVSNLEEFNSTIDSIQGRKFLIISGVSSSEFMKAISNLNLPYAPINSVAWGGIMDPRKGLLLVLKEVFKNPYQKIKDFIENRYLNYQINKYPPSIDFVRENESSKKAKIELVTHSFDYDRYLLNANSDKPAYIPDTEYILWLPNHMWDVHDNVLNKPIIKSGITKDQYQEVINSFLSNLESLSGLKVVIAGYPNADESEDVYEEREFLIGKDTEQLVKYASVVMGHPTGALNFAVIHKKPIRLINFKMLDSDSRMSQMIKMYAKELSTEIYCIENQKDCLRMINDGLNLYDMNAYSDYLDKYIISNQCQLQKEEYFWKRFANFLIQKESVIFKS